jgi:hypothetical protein
MNWLKLLFSVFQLTPVIVAGIEQIHGDAKGSTKKQMAMDALKLATGVATGVAPQEGPAIAAASQLASDVIDGVVATFNATGLFQHKPAASGLVPGAPAAPAFVPGGTGGAVAKPGD